MDNLSNMWISKNTKRNPGLTNQQIPDFILETMLEEAALLNSGPIL